MAGLLLDLTAVRHSTSAVIGIFVISSTLQVQRMRILVPRPGPYSGCDPQIFPSITPPICQYLSIYPSIAAPAGGADTAHTPAAIVRTWVPRPFRLTLMLRLLLLLRQRTPVITQAVMVGLCGGNAALPLSATHSLSIAA